MPQLNFELSIKSESQKTLYREDIVYNYNVKVKIKILCDLVSCVCGCNGVANIVLICTQCPPLSRLKYTSI
jgi:hypothetical protein